MEKREVDVIIPTFRPDEGLITLLELLEQQTLSPVRIIIIDTEDDNSRLFFEKQQLTKRFSLVELYHISPEQFDHGKTRDLGVGYSEAPFFLCMTQDAVPKDNKLLEELWKSFEDPKVAVAYGRQLPRKGADVLESYTREFNYPAVSGIKSKADLQRLGIKTYFCSNVCAMYRRSIYNSLGGFIKKTIFNEDMIYAAAAIQAGYKIQYQAAAEVIHSHHYTGLQQLRRNFDLGVSQADHPQIFAKLPSEKEGKRLVAGTINYLRQKKKSYLIPLFFYQSGCKYLGYRLGKAYKALPKGWIKKLSMNPNYWQ